MADTSVVLAVIDRDGRVYAACEIEAGDEGKVRLLGSWAREVAPQVRLVDVDRIVPVTLGPDGCRSVTEWAEGRGYRLTVADDDHGPGCDGPLNCTCGAVA